MITITIDGKKIAKEFGDKADAILQRTVDVLGEYAVDMIRSMTADQLDRKTWQEFSQSIKTERSANAVTISIDDADMEALETGYASFDIKKGLLKSPKAKQGENGPYVDVPLQHTTSKRGSGTYVQSRSARNTLNKAMQMAKQTGKNVRLGAVAAKMANLAGVQVSPQGTATTFRRVSKNSKPQSWIHPGRQGLGVFKEVAKSVNEIKNRVMTDIAKALK